jgi:hypothetical protein
LSLRNVVYIDPYLNTCKYTYDQLLDYHNNNSNYKLQNEDHDEALKARMNQ